MRILFALTMAGLVGSAAFLGVLVGREAGSIVPTAQAEETPVPAVQAPLTTPVETAATQDELELVKTANQSLQARVRALEINQRRTQAQLNPLLQRITPLPDGGIRVE